MSSVVSILDRNPFQKMTNPTPNVSQHLRLEDEEDEVASLPQRKLKLNVHNDEFSPPTSMRRDDVGSQEDFERAPIQRSSAFNRLGKITYGTLFSRAQTHSQAQKVGKITPNSCERCTCCGLYADMDPLPLCIHTKHLDFLGPTVPMYFDWLKRCCFLMLILLLGSGLHNLMINYNSSRCHETEKYMQTHGGIQHRMTLAPKMNAQILAHLRGEHTSTNTSSGAPAEKEEEEEEGPEIDVENQPEGEKSEEEKKYKLFPCLPNSITILSLANGLSFDRLIERTLTWSCYQVVIMCYLLYLKFRLAKKAERIDSKNPSPSDYSVMVHGLPRNCERQRLKRQIAELFSNTSLDSPQPELKRIHMLYRVDEHKKEVIRPKEFTGYVILTFNHTDTPQQLVDLWYKEQGSWVTKLLNYISAKKPYFVLESEADRKEYHLVVKRAPEPTDIKWQNYGIPSSRRAWKKLKTYLLAICLFFASFIVLKSLHIKDIELHSAHHKTTMYSHYLNVAGLAVAILFLEFVGERILLILVKGEAHKTKTKQELCFIKRCVFYRTVNALLLPLGLQLLFAKATLFMPHGFIVTQFFLFLILTILDPILFITDIEGIIRRFKYLNFRKEILRSPELDLKRDVEEKKRERVFKLSEPSGLQLGERYSNAIVNIFGATTFSTIFPVFLAMTFISLIVNYWIEKVILLRRAKMPKALGTQLPVLATDILEYILMLSCLLNYIILLFVYKPMKTSKDEEAFQWSMYITHTCAGISIVYWILNNTKLIPNLFDDDYRDEDEKENDVYDIARKQPDWLWDYDRLNPATRDRALNEWLGDRATTTTPFPKEKTGHEMGSISSRKKLTMLFRRKGASKAHHSERPNPNQTKSFLKSLFPNVAPGGPLV